MSERGSSLSLATDDDGQMVTSVSRLMGPTHPGRPETEEPHVKKSMKGKREKCDYICRIDQDELGIVEDEFEDLTQLFKMFDCDMDGVLNMMEAQHTLRCVGFRANAEQVKSLVCQVGVDKTHFSLSFNEYLSLVAMQRTVDPTESSLLDVFLSFDVQATGRIPESMFVQLMKTKQVPEEDVQEMLEEYKKIDFDKPEHNQNEAGNTEDQIYYHEFIKMLQQ
eukprot:TRINITY_DN54707_c0_g1_i1.p1 TRINITY_DN54707_c0_g1~~TRINITY_DN54707_c0_g1_i1.p1  ORF type:complete len:222 (-),score=65.89 TRINITY_DN54707_c0_g1_i1:110-775(-)